VALLDRVIADSVVQMAGLADRLEAGTVTLTGWEREMEQLLARYHMASFLAGRAEQLGIAPGSALLSERRLSRDEWAIVKAQVREQLDYLKQFAQDIQRSPDWTRRFNARAAMYGESPKGSYWRGRTVGLDLPDYPAIGTQCRTRCGCSWDIQGNQAYWRRGKGDSCITCVERAGAWKPYIMQVV
jgi:hypothetical protein